MHLINSDTIDTIACEKKPVHKCLGYIMSASIVTAASIWQCGDNRKHDIHGHSCKSILNLLYLQEQFHVRFTTPFEYPSIVQLSRSVKTEQYFCAYRMKQIQIPMMRGCAETFSLRGCGVEPLNIIMPETGAEPAPRP